MTNLLTPHTPHDDQLEETPPAPEPVEQVVACRVGQEWYGVPVRSVREILRVGPIAWLPSVAAHIPGIISVRGTIVSVTDLARLLMVPCSPASDQRRIVIVEVAARQTGLLVDAVAEVVAIPLGQLEPPLTTRDTGHAAYVTQAYRWHDQVMAMLNMEMLLGTAKGGGP